jgi:hypothetical protein
MLNKNQYPTDTVRLEATIDTVMYKDNRRISKITREFIELKKFNFAVELLYGNMLWCKKRDI